MSALGKWLTSPSFYSKNLQPPSPTSFLRWIKNAACYVKITVDCVYFRYLAILERIFVMKCTVSLFAVHFQRKDKKIDAFLLSCDLSNLSNNVSKCDWSKLFLDLLSPFLTETKTLHNVAKSKNGTILEFYDSLS